MRNRGFTLAEVLVVIAILVVLVGLLTPVFTRVKLQATQTVCASNLRQQYLCLGLYRDACDGTDSPGFSPAMGLPPFFAEPYVVPVLGTHSTSVLDLKCQSPVGYPDGSHPPEYYANWPVCAPMAGVSSAQVESEQNDWRAYAEREGSNVVLLFDPNHQKHFPSTTLSNQFAMGMTLAGGLKIRTRRGNCTDRAWWEGD